MSTLKISQFSCIDEAELELGSLTILIGPQASGKSIICKLIYFFYKIIQTDFFVNDEDKDWKAFSAGIVTDFKKWFPPTAWGKRRFTITFTAGPLMISLSRTVASNKPAQNVRLTHSEYMKLQFTEYQTLIDVERRKLTASQREAANLYSSYSRAENVIRRRLEKDLGRDYVDIQTFVPAGRSFFTSIGKAVAAFEQGGLLDPVTVTFGRLFARLRDRWTARYRMFYASGKQDRSYAIRRNNLMQQFFGGEIRIDREKEYIESLDGRKISFSLLSSGQQELLPLWMALDYVVRIGESRQLVYIEEPEAHLFPTAQDALVDYLASVSTANRRLRLLITTHSPYVLAKINNLLKAGGLAQRASKEKRDRINNVIKSESWLRPKDVRAYAMNKRVIESIIHSDGLIDGEYLDNVSGIVSREYSNLLAIEFGK
jgi:predicted ATP-binding protein involved in virulence